MAQDITHGMNIQEVRTLAGHLNDKAGQLETILREVNSKLQETSWVGPDATTFRDRWNNEGVRQLNEAKDILTQASEAAKRNAEAQDNTSQGSSGNF